MENLYCIPVTNKFSLALGEDEDPLELLKIREQEREAKKKEKLLGKENKSKQPEPQKPATKTPKSRVIKDAQQTTQKNLEPKKTDQVDKKTTQARSGERNVKFSGESREDQNNRRNREDGDRPPRNQSGDFKRGPPVERESRGENREFRANDGPRGDRGDRGDRVERVDRDRSDRGDMNDRRSSRGGSRGARGGRGGPRGGRGGFDNRGKREFDRQSGSDKTHGYSGVKPVDKKDGAGSYNWGTHNDEIEDGLNAENNDWNEKSDGEAPPPVLNDSKDSSENPIAPNANPDAAVEEKPVEEEAKELTLDEWKALRGNREKPTYNLRKAGEGEDLTRWKKMYALEKKKESAEEEEEDEEEYDAAAEYPQRVGRQKRVYDIEIQFSDSRRGAGGRGGRGGRGNRGDRQNGRNFGSRRDDSNRPEGKTGQPDQRSPRNRQNAPKVDDEHDFPSLG